MRHRLALQLAIVAVIIAASSGCSSVRPIEFSIASVNFDAPLLRTITFADVAIQRDAAHVRTSNPELAAAIAKLPGASKRFMGKECGNYRVTITWPRADGNAMHSLGFGNLYMRFDGKCYKVDPDFLAVVARELPAAHRIALEERIVEVREYLAAENDMISVAMPEPRIDSMFITARPWDATYDAPMSHARMWAGAKNGVFAKLDEGQEAAAIRAKGAGNHIGGMIPVWYSDEPDRPLDARLSALIFWERRVDTLSIGRDGAMLNDDRVNVSKDLVEQLTLRLSPRFRSRTEEVMKYRR